MFKVLDCKINLVRDPFENLKYRDRTVLMLGRDENGKYLLGAKKDFYPEGIVRMIGGGVDAGEDILAAAIRETKEETGIEEEADKFIPLVQVNVEGIIDGETYTHTVFVYFLQLNGRELVSGDDISDIVRYDETEYRQLVKNYLDLANDHIFDNSGVRFSWGDYGRMYGFIHQAALDEVLERKL